MNDYYVYLHINNETGEPFYVGKGKDNRCNSRHFRNNYWKNIVNKYGYDVILLDNNLSEIEAYDREVYWINRIGRKDLYKGPLVNLTDGGDGVVGRIGKPLSEEHKNKLSNINKGKKLSEEHRNKISQTLKGHSVSNEARKKMSDKLKGRKAWNKGKKLSEEQKRILSEKSKGQTHNRGRICLNNGIVNKSVLPSEVDYYISIGFVFGRDMSIYKNNNEI